MDLCCTCSTFFYIVVGSYILLKIYNKLTTGVFKGNERLNGKTVVITGANSGYIFFLIKHVTPFQIKLF